jgi:hypothetical protein
MASLITSANRTCQRLDEGECLIHGTSPGTLRRLAHDTVGEKTSYNMNTLSILITGCNTADAKKMQLTRSPRREFPSCWTIYDLNRLGSWLRKSITISVLHCSNRMQREVRRNKQREGDWATELDKYPAETIFLSWLCNTSEMISNTPSPERSLKKIDS